MNTTALFKLAWRGNGGRPSRSSYVGREMGWQPMDAAVWVMIAVATALFSLFIAAYLMRMEEADWFAIGLPWQVWLSTTLLVGGSVMLQRAGSAARHHLWHRSWLMLVAGGICGMAFLAAQAWAWYALLSVHVKPVGNPAASFFYLLTAIHGLHVLGGLIAWCVTATRFRRGTVLPSAKLMQQRQAGRSIALCARYWHFLLTAWVVLLATFAGITPHLVSLICGTN